MVSSQAVEIEGGADGRQRRPTVANGARRSSEPLLQRIAVVEGPGMAALVGGLTAEGLDARLVRTDEVGAIAAGVVIFAVGDDLPAVGAALRPLRLRQASVATVALGDVMPSVGVLVLDEVANALLPATASPGLVAAQVRALARLLAMPAPSATPESISVRNVTIDFSRREVYVDGRLMPLTPTEFRILALLAGRPGQVISHTEIFREIHSYPFAANDSEAKDMLKVHISRLRGKLTEAGAGPDLIVNVRGFGYLLERRAGRDPRTRPLGESTKQ